MLGEFSLAAAPRWRQVPRLNETGQYLGKYYVLCANMSSTETSLNDVPNVASRLQSLRLTAQGYREPAAGSEDGDVTDNAAAAAATAAVTTATAAGGSTGGGGIADAGGPSSREPLRNMQTIGNVTLSRARRALNFVCDEDQPTSSSAARSEASFSNGDK